MMINNERGFALLNVIFLTLITSFAAIILMNAAPRVKNPDMTLRLTAIYLAEEEFAELENLAASGELFSGSYEFLGENSDLTTYNSSEKVDFEVKAIVTERNNLRDAKVTVTIVDDENFKLEMERTILFVPNET